MTEGIASVARPPGDNLDPRDPANASGLVAYLASAAAWLTGQVFRVDGSKVQRPRGWSVLAEYHSQSGGAIEADELVTGPPGLYGTAPADRPA